MTLVVTFSNDARQDGAFNVLVEGQKVGQQTTTRRSPEEVVRFFDVRNPLPAALTNGKGTVTVRFQASGETPVSGVFGVRILRAAQ